MKNKRSYENSCQRKQEKCMKEKILTMHIYSFHFKQTQTLMNTHNWL